MQNVQAIFVDCDGVLYDVDLLPYEQFEEAARQAGSALGLDWTNFDEVHRDLKKNRGYRGFYNTVLELCRTQGVSFKQLSEDMVEILDYSKIQPNPELLSLLQKNRQKRNLCIFTNNTRPHLEKVFNRLFGCTIQQSGLPVITAEDTLQDGYFHTKKMPGVLSQWCKKMGPLPQNTLILDDTNTVIETAQKEGLQYRKIENDNMTMQILKELYETNKRCSHLRKTPCGISTQKSSTHD